MLLQNGVFESLRSSQPDDRLRLNLNCFSCGGIAAHACLAVCFYSAANARNHELPRALGFFDGQLEELIEK